MSDCEIPQFYVHHEPVARKAHKCCECQAAIAPGEKHFIVTAKWDGVINRYRQHLLCEEACEFIRDFVEYECLGYGDLWRWYCEAKDWLNDPFHRKDAATKKVRAMMAKILRRERGAGTP